MPSTYHTTEGIVIKKTPYGEADFLVRVLTCDFGKIDLRARGARYAKSKLNSNLDFLDIISLSFVKNGDKIPTIIDAEKSFLGGQEGFIEYAKVARFLDLIVPLENKDTKLFSLIFNFFSQKGKISGRYIVENIILHEGYGGVLSLPKETQDFIMNKWSVLKS